MKSGLDKRGKLLPPNELATAIKRRKQCGYEVARIQDQLNDAGRRARFASEGEYAAWRASAEQALRVFRSETYQLEEWIEAEHRVLVGAALELIQTLEHDGVPLEPDEAAVVKKLRTFLEATNNNEPNNRSAET